MKAPWKRRKSVQSFTLVEMLVAIAVLGLMIAMVAQMLVSSSTIFRTTGADVDAFQASRDAFAEMTKNISEATLSPSWQYDSVTAPTTYKRTSNLQFVCGQAADLITTPASGTAWTTHAIFFQAPLGYSANPTNSAYMPSALNVVGYGIQYGSDQDLRPPFLNSAGTPVAYRYRYRLMEICQDSQNLSIYDNPAAPTDISLPQAWYTSALTDGVSTHVLADNVIALIIQPQTALANKTVLDTNLPVTGTYTYNTHDEDTDGGAYFNQLPPIIQVTVVTIDEMGAARLQAQSQDPSVAPDFGLAGLFQDASKYQADLGTLETNLQTDHLQYRIFSSSITLPQSKWSVTASSP